ncbi:hypothetical protein AKJ51_02475 [candidate division MSBL1 archaeon SCGC-AAA382A20]|uniref:Uncharacterized protein n=1 Tax=candidate division MSBL1 archaeon SCGC-AAA382A20 TaxID=1698280 RepID=A0A133VKJ1_9EURY|nr:hypothetical protein AKJ51_02475 [candidate division MSBL1 archaeon SCGC-AAA382A20]
MIALIIGITAASVGVGLLALSKDQKDNYVEMEEVGSPYSIIIYRETVGSSSKDENERIIELA